MFGTLSFDRAQPGIEEDSRTSSLTSHRRRSQVARACANCRAYRIKCDNEQPCRNCRRKGRTCDHEGSKEVRTFAGAVKEIEKLNKQVQELQDLLEKANLARDDSVGAIRKAPGRKGNTSLPANLDPLVEHGGNQHYWECIQVETRVGTTQCYGPASVFYFIARLNIHLDQASAGLAIGQERTAIADRMSLVSNTDFESNFMHMAGPINRIYMERGYEEFYLNIFWEEYHSLYPIIEEADFWNYHRSLWDKSQKFRKPSALVDIILAICLQHGTTAVRLEGRPKALADKSDEIIASRWFYRRCQSLLTNHLETPSIMTLQTHILSVIYLLNANSQNAAHSILAIAVRTGIILGLHLEPPGELPDQQREARKRLWWLLYSLEMKFAMELGRPLAVNISQVTCGLPSDETFAYTTVQQKTILSKEAAFLSFSVHFVRLVLATRAIYITFYDECAAVLGQNQQKSLYQNPPALEKCAEFLISKMQYAENWLREVPAALRVGRDDIGDSFSIDQSRMRLEANLPRWQLQQSLFLELHYQSMMMSLYRPFICFPPPKDTAVPWTDRCADACLHHAQTITKIIFQSLVESTLLENHHEAFRWQWAATLSLVGYVMAYPASMGLSGPLSALHLSVQVFERLGGNFAIAMLAKQTTEELLARVCTLSQTTKLCNTALSTSTALHSTAEPSDTLPVTQSLELAPQSDPNLLMDMSNFPASSLSMLTAGSNLAATDFSDRFAWGQNLISDDHAYSCFGGKMTGFSTAPLPWTTSTANSATIAEDDDFFRLLNVPMGDYDQVNMEATVIPDTTM